MTLLPHCPHSSLELVSRRRFGAYVAAGRLNRAEMIWSDNSTVWATNNMILAAKVHTLLGTAHYLPKEA